MIYFTADTHFGHGNIIKYCNRPFKSVQEMDAAILANINARVGQKDTLYHLGDFSMGDASKYREQIVCDNIILIRGNHDYDKSIHDIGFNEVCHYKEVKFNGAFLVLFHYGMRVWNKSHHGAWHLYGHSHGGLQDLGNKSFDIGVDSWDYKPLSFDDVEKEMSKRTFQPVDHHK